MTPHLSVLKQMQVFKILVIILNYLYILWKIKCMFCKRNQSFLTKACITSVTFISKRQCLFQQWALMCIQMLNASFSVVPQQYSRTYKPSFIFNRTTEMLHTKFFTKANFYQWDLNNWKLKFTMEVLLPV